MDGFSDSPRESYRLDLKDLPAGENTVVVKASDSVENSTTAKKVLPPAHSR